jgi:hypothetical protein
MFPVVQAESAPQRLGHTGILRHGRLLQQGLLPDMTGRAAHCERVECEAVVDGRSGPALDPASRLTASDGYRWPVVGVQGHVGGKGLEPQPMGAGSRLDPTAGPARLRSDLCRRA